MMRLGLIDAGGANLGSVRFALERLGVTVQTVREAAHLQDVDRLILPGVGSAAEGMRRLNAQGLTTPLRDWRRPLLGICLGMQLLYEASDEGDVLGLGLLTGRVRQMTPSPGIRMPQMGWNRVHASAPCALLDDIDDGAHMYFVHGYAAPLSP
ncbi:MAG TPA: imidazole glycerol phosphate synthase subunit HisH, partial [Xanthomonadaceae bacterium]|nr:imidazole glycerol phosphate synthase subunit HisH [Xanthomonadaceae bacterium]